MFELREQKTAGERKRTGDGKRMVGKMEMEEGEGKVKEQEREISKNKNKSQIDKSKIK